MATIQVQAPLGDLSFSHSGREVKVSGNPDAVMDWKRQNDGVLYGAFGHIFRQNNCALSDVCAMLLDVYGPQRVTLSEAVKKQCTEELRSIPKDAIP